MRYAIFLLVLICAVRPAIAEEPLKFGVLNQRPITVTAQLWNPILNYLSKKSGLPLVLSMDKTAPETTENTVRGEYDFVYTNHLFTPERVGLGYRVIARFNSSVIRGQIVVLDHSTINSLADLQNKKMAFPSLEAFAGYALPMKRLQSSKVQVVPVFAGSQEGAMMQLVAGAVDAAGVNDRVMNSFAQRENIKYRIIDSSEAYLGLPIMANPRVPHANVEKLRKALIEMGNDTEGRAVLDAANLIIKSDKALEFVSANDTDYNNYRRFYEQEKR